VRRELETTRAKLAERKLVEKAKGIVMQQRRLSEDEAYGALRKMAMDQNLALAEVARRVISVAQLLG
jgi:response regulator NasT